MSDVCRGVVHVPPPPAPPPLPHRVRHHGDRTWLNVGMGQFDPWNDLMHTRGALEEAQSRNQDLQVRGSIVVFVCLVCLVCFGWIRLGFDV